MRTGVLLTVTVLGLLGWSTRAEACSCVRGPENPRQAMIEAKDSAGAIYLARVPEPSTFEVLEVFKGTLRKGDRFRIPDGSRTCALSVRVGETRLVYAPDPEGRKVSHCSRTRPIREDLRIRDADLAWLRDGMLPPLPVALQRVRISCEPCTADTVAPPLMGQQVDRNGAREAHRAGRAFWTSGAFDESDPGRRRAVGRSEEGHAYALLQTPHWEAAGRCQQRVTRWRCARLEEVMTASAGEPALRCVEPSDEQRVCDEGSSRRVETLPPETLSGARCDWLGPSRAACRLSETSIPLEPDAPRFPLLRCAPAYEDRTRASCEVIEGP